VRGLLAAVSAVAVAVTAAGAATALAGRGAEAPPAPGAVSVSAREFALTLSRPAVGAGPVRVQLINRGEDDHDLWVSRVGGDRSWQYPVTKPGEAATRTLRLAAGRYRMICSLEGHEALGMRATLRVRR
jgi:plastocyanin